MHIEWTKGRNGATPGYVRPDEPEREPATEDERPKFVITPMTFPPGFTLRHNDYNLGPYLFLSDLGRHPTLDEAKEATAAATT